MLYMYNIIWSPSWLFVSVLDRYIKSITYVQVRYCTPFHMLIIVIVMAPAIFQQSSTFTTMVPSRNILHLMELAFHK